ncbi:MAG: hypothetical protein KGO49_13290 [Gammaproteobacteria bacterium]|nr:hypothetical protein [Gammaproteobacteria bacterium]
MDYIAFSLDDEAVVFEIAGQTFKIEQGLKFVELQSIRYKRLDALALEKMIYAIEEILEQLKLDYKIQRVAETADVYMQQLSQLFFNNDKVINRAKLEHAFNEFVEHIEYYVQKSGSENFYLFAYFVFVREVMHHLNVVEIYLRSL